MSEILNTSSNIETKSENFSSVEIKECRKDTIQLLIEFELWRLNNELWHEIKPWENIWRVIHNHATENNKPTISADRLEDVRISPGDKIYFTKDYVYVKFLKGWYKILPFDSNNCVWSDRVENSKPKEILKPKPIPIIQTKPQEVKIEAEKPWFQTIFDKDSPLLWDQIAYKNEVEIRKLHGKTITKLIDRFCKWSLVDESFLYGVIARESRFDKDARSHTWVKGLGQITLDTVWAIANLNETKVKNDSASASLYINDSLKNKDGTLNRTKVLHPLNQLKLTISYLLYLEGLFQDVWDNNFRKELIITSYNLWPGKTQKILWKYKHIQNWDWLKQALRQETKRWEISQWKFKEITEYVPAVMENIKIASL